MTRLAIALIMWVGSALLLGIWLRLAWAGFQMWGPW